MMIPTVFVWMKVCEAVDTWTRSGPEGRTHSGQTAHAPNPTVPQLSMRNAQRKTWAGRDPIVQKFSDTGKIL